MSQLIQALESMILANELLAAAEFAEQHRLCIGCVQGTGGPVTAGPYTAGFYVEYAALVDVYRVTACRTEPILWKVCYWCIRKLPLYREWILGDVVYVTIVRKYA